uniref:CSON006828 protein n=1 Tax=Culicoides sonorensis TaxID=179676 RepID=A0A336KB18_CULSO
MSRKSKKGKTSDEDELKFYFVLPDMCKLDIERTSQTMRAAYISYCKHWDNNIDTGSIISESTALHFDVEKLTRNEIFVFPQFEGKDFDTKAFEHVKLSRALILGPRCLLDCLTNNIPIPISSTPVYTIAMRNIVISLSGGTSEERERLRQLIGYMGGMVYDELNMACTHLVSSTVMSKKYDIAAVRKLKVMHFAWVYEVWEKSCHKSCHADDDEFWDKRMPIFYCLNVSSTNLTAKARDEIRKLITSYGGTYEGAFSSERTHILILEKNGINSAKFNSAIKYKKECLTPQWVYDSIEQGYSLPFEKYRVSALRVSTPTKEFMQSSSSEFNPNSTQLSEISHAESLAGVTINETGSTSLATTITSIPNTRSSTTISSKTKSSDSKNSEPKYKTILDNIDMSFVKKRNGFLDGCKIYLSGFKSDAKDKLIKILNIGSAIRYDHLNTQVTHMIIGKYVAHDFMTLKKKKINPILLTLEWLIESLHRGEPTETEKYLYEQDSKETTDEPEQPSPASKKAIQSMNHSFKRPSAPPKFSLHTLSDKENELSIKNISKSRNIIQNPKPGSSKEHELNHELVNQYLSHHEATKLSTSGLKACEPDTEIHTEDLEKLNYFENKTVFVWSSAYEYEEEAVQAVMDCEAAQAKVVNECYKGVVDFIITPIIIDDTPIPVKGKHVVSEIFLEYAIRENKIPELKYYYRPIKYTDQYPKPLINITISFSIYTGDERQYIKNLASALGANEDDKFVKKSKPVLIIPEPSGKKYEAAKCWGLPAVTATWLLKCYETQSKVQMDPYLVENVFEMEEVDNEDTLKNSNINKTEGSSTLRNPAVIPSSTEDEIDLHNTSRKEKDEYDVNSSHAFSNFFDECEKFSQKLIDNRVTEDKDEFVVKHKRLQAIKKDTPDKRNFLESPRSSNTSNISANVNELDLDTPAKTLIKDILREETAKETPNTKKIKHCIQTPGYQTAKTPEIPKCIDTPDSTFSRLPNETPNTRLNNKRKLEAREIYHIPSKERRKNTSFTEHQRQFWKKALGDDYVEQTGDTQVSVVIPIESGSPSKESIKLSSDSFSGGTPTAMREYQKVVERYTPKSSTPIEKNIKTPAKPYDLATLIESPSHTNIRGCKIIAEFINSRKLNEKKKSEGKLAESGNSPQKRRLGYPTDVIEPVNVALINTESQEFDVIWKERPRKPKSNMKFMFTSITEEDKLRYMKIVEDLGAQNINITAGFNKACTHLVFERPNRGEKVMAAIAAGKCCLMPLYLEDSLKAGKFLSQEEYEWGNPNCKHKPTNLSEAERTLSEACYNWRIKITSQGWNGAFDRFRVILHVMKRDAFKRIIDAGNGTVLEVSPPYYNNQEALDATHCFIDSKSEPLTERDIKRLKEAGVRILQINFINAYLNDENVDIDKFSASFKTNSTNRSK